jgi:RHS repeat-associated protein
VSGNVSRTYRDDFRIASTQVNGAHTVDLAYDPDGLLKQAGGLTMTRDANAFITGTTLGKVTDSRTYNAFGEQTAYTVRFDGSVIYDEGYDRDKLGRVATRADQTGGELHSYAYAYDAGGRLTGATDNGVTTSYSYDANGSRTDGAAVHNGQDQLLSRGTVSYSYDASGELTAFSDSATGDHTAYQYNAFGNLRAASIPDGRQIEYVVDGRQRRVGKKVNGTLVQGFLYQDYLAPVAELDGSNQVVSRFVYGTRGNVPDYMTKGGNTYRIISDRLGSVRVVVDTATGDVAQRLRYDAFGRVTQDTNPGFQPFGFAGGLYDPDTKLTRFGTRDYDAQTGRWTAKDLARFSGGQTNLYAYVQNDPVNLIDPDGLAGEGESSWSSSYQKVSGWYEGNSRYAGSEGGTFTGPASTTTWQGKLFGIQDPNGDTTIHASGTWERPNEKLGLDFRTAYGFCPSGAVSGSFSGSAHYNKTFGAYNLFDFDATAGIKGDFSGNGSWNAQATIGASEYLRAGVRANGDFSGTVEVAPVLTVGVEF